MRSPVSVLLALLLTTPALAQTAAIDSATVLLKRKDFGAATGLLTAELQDSAKLAPKELAMAHCLLSEAQLQEFSNGRGTAPSKEGISAGQMELLSGSFRHLKAAYVAEADAGLKKRSDNQALLLKRELMNAANQNFQGIASQKDPEVKQALIGRNLLCSGYMLTLDSTYQLGYNYLSRTLLQQGDSLRAKEVIEKGLRTYAVTPRREPDILALEMFGRLAKIQMDFLNEPGLAKQTLEEGLALLDKEDELVNANTGMTQMRKDVTIAKVEEVRKALIELGKQIEAGK
jgi:hypothetical protein